MLGKYLSGKSEKEKFNEWLNSVDEKKIEKNINEYFKPENIRVSKEELDIFNKIKKEEDRITRSNLIVSGPF